MSDAAIPITIGGYAYHLRYTYPDFKKMEDALGMGYVHFLRDEIFRSLTAQEVYLWQGLKKENADGRWIHVYPDTPEGRQQAGELLWDHLRETGDMRTILSAVFDAFTQTGPWKIATDDKKPEEKAPKNLQT
jgi:hypothetical protein